MVDQEDEPSEDSIPLDPDDSKADVDPEPVDMGSKMREVDKTRGKIGIAIAVVATAIAIASASVVILKMQVLLSADHQLTSMFMASEDEQLRSQALIYMGIVVASQSAVTIFLFVWAKQIINIAAKLMIPLNERNGGSSMEQVVDLLEKAAPMMKMSQSRQEKDD